MCQSIRPKSSVPPNVCHSHPRIIDRWSELGQFTPLYLSTRRWKTDPHPPVSPRRCISLIELGDMRAKLPKCRSASSQRMDPPVLRVLPQTKSPIARLRDGAVQATLRETIQARDMVPVPVCNALHTWLQALYAPGPVHGSEPLSQLAAKSLRIAFPFNVRQCCPYAILARCAAGTERFINSKKQATVMLYNWRRQKRQARF